MRSNTDEQEGRKMTTLFDKLDIGKITLKNRIVMAPMTRSRALDADGTQPSYVAEYYAQRASGGLLITEATNISAMAKGYVRTPGIYSEAQIESWKTVANAVHRRGGKIFMQIFHTGRIALPDFFPGNVKPVAPSAVKAAGQNYTDHAGPKDFVEPREMTGEEIRQTVADFAQAAKNAIAAGFDGVEIHGANGYLIQQFLSTNVNKRHDEYGGSVENRARFLFEVVDAVIGAIGQDRTGLRLSPGSEAGDIKESDAETLYDFAVRELNSRDLAYLHIGTTDKSRNWHSILRPVYKGIYFAGVGFTKESGEKLLAEGGADAIIYGRPFIANPDLPERFRLGTPLNSQDQATFYTPGEKGYTDYPSLAAAAAG